MGMVPVDHGAIPVKGGFGKTVDEVARQCDVFNRDCPLMPGIL